MNNINCSRIFIYFASIFILHFSFSYGQNDSLNIANTLTSIDDSVSTSDTLQAAVKKIPFLIEFREDSLERTAQTFNLFNHDLDFMDYRYSGDAINYLPFGFLNNFGSLGTPNEPNIYGFGFGNISLSIDNKSLSNFWNNSIDLNRVQTEDISQLEIVSPHKSFLFGFNSNPAHIKIRTADSLRTKPLSRIRYYQASNDEGLIDAYFSARVLPKLALSFRFTNSSIENNYKNSEFGSWKFNFRGVYKLNDSLYSSLEFNHLKLNTPLNGGVDISSLSPTEFDIYNNISSVLFDERSNETKENSITGTIYGYILPFGKSKIDLTYFDNRDSFTNNADTTSPNRINLSKGFSTILQHSTYYNELYIDLNAGFEQIDYELESIKYDDKVDNYYGSVYTKYSFASGLLKPGFFAKVSKYNNQNTFGLGAEVIISPSENFHMTLGYSDFEKPLSVVEEQFLSGELSPRFTTLFGSVEYSNNNINSSISLFNVNRSDAILPVMLQSDDYPQTGEIIFKTIPSLRTSGINFNSNIEIWNILLSANLNYNSYSDNIFNKLDESYSAFAGLYYVDTLFNNNLNLKTGFNIYLYDMPNEHYYDFEKMRSTKFKFENDEIEIITLDKLTNDKFRLDFFLAGRIQDAATFYFVYENILGNQYYIVPYFPMPEGGIRIGISWDFLD